MKIPTMSALNKRRGGEKMLGGKKTIVEIFGRKPKYEVTLV